MVVGRVGLFLYDKTMGARKARMIRKANKLIDFGYKPTFRQLMESYRFWKLYLRRGKSAVIREYRM